MGYIALINPAYPHICPHCNCNSASLQREGNDLYCFVCGWRDSQYFKDQMFVYRIPTEPILKQRKSEQDIKAYKRQWGSDHRQELRIYQRQYRLDHLEACRRYGREWARKATSKASRINRGGQNVN